jgi:hypothetical protein
MRTCVSKQISIKKMVLRGNGYLSDLGKVMLQKFCGLCFTCESWDTKLVEREKAISYEEILGDIVCWFLVCGPFAARGAKGEEEYP